MNRLTSLCIRNFMMRILKNIWDFLFFHLPRFIKNLWKFKGVLYNHYPYDYQSILYFLQVALKDISDHCEKHGYEVDVTRIKKVKKMRRAVEIIENINEDKYHELAEKELGKIPERLMLKIYQNRISREDRTQEEADHIKAVYERAIALEIDEWNELMEILKGQDYSKFDRNKDFYEPFDGSGLRTWWD